MFPKGLQHVHSRDPFKLGPGVYGIISDLQIPFQHETAVETAISHFKRKRIYNLIINGDFMDFYSVSDHIKDPRYRNFNNEIIAGKSGLKYLKKNFKNIFYKEGNHEERLERFKWNKVPEFRDLEALSFKNLLELDNLGIKSIGDKRTIMLGKLPVIHGHEYRSGRSTPVGAARWLFLRGSSNGVVSHFHQSSEFTTPCLDGRIVKTWSIGCLCQLDPDFAVKNNWNLGYAIVHVYNNGNFEVENITLSNNGKDFK